MVLETVITFIVVERYEAWNFVNVSDRVLRSEPIGVSKFMRLRNPIQTYVGIPDVSSDGRCLKQAILRRAESMPLWSDQLFICVLFSDQENCDFSEINGDSLTDMKFTIVNGIQNLESGRSVSWDAVSGLDNSSEIFQVLKECKPPIPCLRKVEVEEASSCHVCHQEISAESRAVSTVCSHSFHSVCIVGWLTKCIVCPACPCRLYVGL